LVRFDDSLATVLAGDTGEGLGARSTWRQLVDLIGRGRVPADATALARLRALRPAVPAEVRAASARALAWATPPAALVALFAEDELAIAAPVLRTATLAPDDWCTLLSGIGSAGRSVLRHRRDLPDQVRRGLDSFGPTDFVLGHEAPAPSLPAEVPIPVPPADTPLSETPFVALGDVTRGLPLVAEALRRAEAPSEPAPRFEIADLVARIDAFQRDRPDPAPRPVPEPEVANSFLYETDASGVIRWVEGVARPALVGLSLATLGSGGVRFDAVPGGALRRRARFTDARLEIGGTTPLAGSWRLSGAPLFERETGRFTGMRGTGRRPRRDQQAAPVGSDQLRQLVHELRTPANAIMGFAELIGTELLGPVPPHYRERAETIQRQATGLVAAIEDLDTAARIEARALDLRPGSVPLEPMLDRIVVDLAPLARLRRVTVQVDAAGHLPALATDDRAAERLIARLLSAIVAAGTAGESLCVTAGTAGEDVTIAVTRPRALAADDNATLFRLDAAADEQDDGTPLLGIGFTLRLARNLAVELGGALSIAADRLTLRLPADVTDRVEQASTN
jgi:signal transduction histidine kinase